MVIPADNPGLEVAVAIKELGFAYGATAVLHNITLDFPARHITALIGPSGCGKSTLLRCLNRIHERIPGAAVTHGSIHLGGIDINRADIDLQELRRRVGMVFQKSNPFPKSIFENVAFGLRLRRRWRRAEIHERVEQALRGAALWDEVKDRLHARAHGLSGGQQQRLCIARALAGEPSVLLLDEPCSALDPVATLKVEELLTQLKKQYTLIMVTHNMAQASRCADFTVFMNQGQLIESGPTMQIFGNPHHPQTLAYVSGSFG